MEDLVPLASAGSVDRTDDALPTESVEHRQDLRLADLGVLR